MYSSSILEQPFSAMSLELAEHINNERYQGFSEAGNLEKRNCIIVSHCAPTCNLLECHLMLQALTLPFPINPIHPTLSRHDPDPGPGACGIPGGFPSRHRRSLTWLLLFAMLTAKLAQSIRREPASLLGMQTWNCALNLEAGSRSLLRC